MTLDSEPAFCSEVLITGVLPPSYSNQHSVLRTVGRQFPVERGARGGYAGGGERLHFRRLVGFVKRVGFAVFLAVFVFGDVP